MSNYDSYKKEVLEVCQEMLADGFFGAKHGSAGNVSVLVEGEERVVITPSGINFALLTVDDICVVNFQGGCVEGTHQPSIETGMHLAVYKNRPDVNAVIHTHQHSVSVLSIINEQIPALYDEVAVAIGHIVDVVPYGLSGSDDLMNGVIEKVANRCHCYILQNHGALSVGPNLRKTQYYAELLERIARAYCDALATGRTVNPLPEPLPMGLFQITTAKQDMEIERKNALKPAP